MMDDKLTPIDVSKIDMSKFDFSKVALNAAQPHLDSIAGHQREMERTVQAVQRERERKKANEEAYRQETIRSLRAIEQNTANLYTLVDLISKSNEQQEEIIEIITEVLSIAKAKTKEEAESKFRKVMDKITKSVEDGETLGKIATFATTVWTLAQPIIEKLPHIGG